MDVNKIVTSAVACLFIVTTVGIISTNVFAADKMEKCYGITKAGMNDCQTASASCASSALKDNQRDAFIFLPVGTCGKITGGSLSADSIKSKS